MNQAVGSHTEKLSSSSYGVHTAERNKAFLSHTRTATSVQREE